MGSYATFITFHQQPSPSFSALKYPIYSFQWHPAKPLFEWTTLKDIRHTEEAVLIAQYFADFFVNQGKLLSL